MNSVFLIPCTQKYHFKDSESFFELLENEILIEEAYEFKANLECCMRNE